jgi:tetratricopeptide (TPR) repeat protein
MRWSWVVILACVASTPLRAQTEAAPAGAEVKAEDQAVEAAPVAVDPEAERKAKIQQLLDECDKSYSQRTKSGLVEESIAKAKEVLALDPQNYDAQWRLARGAYWIADGSEDAKVKEKWGKVGWDAGIAGTKLRPGAIEAQFWGAASLGMYAKGVGVMKAVWDGLGKQYEQWVRKAMDINPKYASAGPPRALGRYYFTLPGIAGGDNDKAIKYLEQSRQLAPDALRTRAWLAESYLEDGDKAKAKVEIDFCLAADVKKGDYADNVRMRKDCEKLSKKL